MTIKAKQPLGWIKDGSNLQRDLFSPIGVMMSSVAQNDSCYSFQCCTSFCTVQQPFYPSMRLSLIVKESLNAQCPLLYSEAIACPSSPLLFQSLANSNGL